MATIQARIGQLVAYQLGVPTEKKKHGKQNLFRHNIQPHLFQWLNVTVHYHFARKTKFQQRF